jgi:hypothetical protein
MEKTFKLANLKPSDIDYINTERQRKQWFVWRPGSLEIFGEETDFQFNQTIHLPSYFSAAAAI